MASLKEVKNRINSVKSTRQITSAMKMVASAKLHKAQGRITSMLPYQRKLNEILTNFLRTDTSFESAYTVRREVKRVALVVCASNSSLCGAFNSNVARLLEKTLAEYHSLGKENIVIYAVGKKAEEAVKRTGCSYKGTMQQLVDKPAYVDAYKLAEELMMSFADEKVDRVELIYHHFKSMGSQILTREEYLPIDLSKMTENGSGDEKNASRGYNNDYIVEPSVGAVISELLPMVLCQKIYTMLLDSVTSEHAARMLAMQAATDNADDLVQELTIQYNKTRQQAITSELLDIIGGSMK
ncbi:MAG TPA: F0F1 ATP synthase subunit gamma [Candidatus Bacteroides avicola]|jgi:F-type H+-transporting ATPase subunit gamma|uniref:ATP synthase gamma chain n=1 Tax=Candidatus Bacteroides avicola TaxID=2838468 RepID=A0A9D2KU86_9BACE|nr:F0F1 ATP synthase subunit gamma [Mediterranea sp. An20]MBW9202657.1 F0F1 ATP synthase subunit gamma [Bacteroidales bacterium SW292]OUP08359.1 ATP synthase F1 subunit gamma [Mediterranea sp. An20]HJA85936.1 F0F1 ATP synthase subunit gamma [Candidatus Bacteroides avicola]